MPQKYSISVKYQQTGKEQNQPTNYGMREMANKKSI